MTNAAELIRKKEQEAAEARATAERAREAFELATHALALVEAQLEGMRAIYEATAGKPKENTHRTARKRALGDDWKAVLSELVRLYPADVDYNELRNICEALGAKTNSNTIRSQMSLYKAKGYVESTEPGRFLITKKGAEAAGTTLPNINGPAEVAGPLNEIDELLGGNIGYQPSNSSGSAIVQDHHRTFDDDLDDDIPF